MTMDAQALVGFNFKCSMQTIQSIFKYLMIKYIKTVDVRLKILGILITVYTFVFNTEKSSVRQMVFFSPSQLVYIHQIGNFSA